MQYHVIQHYKHEHRNYEGPLLITPIWEVARACAVERFFELYNKLCNEVGDRLDTFISVGNEPSQSIPLFAIREFLNDPNIIERCTHSEKLVITIDGGDYVSIHFTK